MIIYSELVRISDSMCMKLPYRFLLYYFIHYKNMYVYITIYILYIYIYLNNNLIQMIKNTIPVFQHLQYIEP